MVLEGSTPSFSATRIYDPTQSIKPIGCRVSLMVKLSSCKRGMVVRLRYPAIFLPFCSYLLDNLILLIPPTHTLACSQQGGCSLGCLNCFFCLRVGQPPREEVGIGWSFFKANRKVRMIL